jgi:hypothetical protein
MKWKLTDRSAKLRFLSSAVLVAGLLLAVVINIRAGQVADNPLGDPDDSKQYLRQMELYGGKANVVASDVRQWFGSLWHGKSLAFTVGFLALVLAGGLRFLADTESAGGDAQPPPASRP